MKTAVVLSVWSVETQTRNAQQAERAGVFQHGKKKALGETSLQPSCI